jgi:AcrR family transcriptional regulator
VKPATTRHPRPTQAERSARTRSALLESAARGLSRHGYANLVLEEVARDAGYTRGALYHQFKNKEDLVLAVLRWVDETWWPEVGALAEEQPTAAAGLLALARGHAVYCRRDIARAMMTLRIEFSGKDDPVGRRLYEGLEAVVKYCAQLIEAGRKEGSIPAGPPVQEVAIAWTGAMEGVVIALAGRAPYDEEMVARAAAGILGLEGPPASDGSD